MSGIRYLNFIQGAQHWSRILQDRQSWDPSFYAVPRPDNSGRIIPTGSQVGLGSYPFWYNSWITSGANPGYQHSRLHSRVRECGLSEQSILQAAWDEWPDERQKPISREAFAHMKDLIDDIREAEGVSEFGWLIDDQLNTSYIGPLSYRNQIAAALERWSCYTIGQAGGQQYTVRTGRGSSIAAARTDLVDSPTYALTATNFVAYYINHNPGDPQPYTINVYRHAMCPIGREKDHFAYGQYPIRDGYDEYPDNPCDIVLAIHCTSVFDGFTPSYVPGLKLYKLEGTNYKDAWQAGTQTLLQSWTSSDMIARFDDWNLSSTIGFTWQPTLFHNVTDWWDWDEVWGDGSWPDPNFRFGLRTYDDNLTYSTGGSYTHPSGVPASDAWLAGIQYYFNIYVYVDKVDDIGSTA